MGVRRVGFGKSLELPKDAEQQIENLKKHDFPASILVLEAWSDEATFYIWNEAKYQPKPDGAALQYDDFDFSGSPWPDPKDMVDALHKAGLHLVLWQIPVYKKQGANEILNVQNTLDREDAVRRGLCVHLADGTPYTIPDGHWFSGSMIPDYTNPETVQTWFAKRQYLLDMGVDGFKTDGGEFIYRPDVRFMDGSDGKSGKESLRTGLYLRIPRFYRFAAGFVQQSWIFRAAHCPRCTGAAISNHRTQNCEASFTPDYQPRHPVFCSGALILPGLQARFRRWTSTAAQHRWPASAQSCNGIPSRTAGSSRS